MIGNLLVEKRLFKEMEKKSELKPISCSINLINSCFDLIYNFLGCLHSHFKSTVKKKNQKICSWLIENLAVEITQSWVADVITNHLGNLYLTALITISVNEQTLLLLPISYTSVSHHFTKRRLKKNSNNSKKIYPLKIKLNLPLIKLFKLL